MHVATSAVDRLREWFSIQVLHAMKIIHEDQIWVDEPEIQVGRFRLVLKHGSFLSKHITSYKNHNPLV